MLAIIQHRGWWYTFSSILIILSIAGLSVWGLRFGIDFTGGSLMEVSFAGATPKADVLSQAFETSGVGTVTVQPTGTSGAILRFRDVTEDEHQAVLQQLAQAAGSEVEERRFETIGPTIGAELKSRASWAILVALFFIVSYIAWAFRKVSRPVQSWKYGVVAIVALAHDLLITLGAFSALGYFRGVEVDSLFVSAMLTVLGFSVHDTIVVFDRTRENLFRGVSNDFETTVNKSVNDTLVRSINTSLTTILVLSMLYLFGGESIRYFTLALIIGITIGTYSSIFIASPLLVDWFRFAKRKPRR